MGGMYQGTFLQALLSLTSQGCAREIIGALITAVLADAVGEVLDQFSD